MPCSPNPTRSNCSRRQLTFIEDTRTPLLRPKRLFGNTRKSVDAISDAIAYNLVGKICRLSVVFDHPPPTRTSERSVGPRSRRGSVPLPIAPYLLGKPLPGRRHPVKAASSEAGARNAPALKGWRWCGLLGPSRQDLLFRSQAQSALSADAPFDVAARAHEAGDVLPDAVVEHGLPRHDAKAEAPVAAQGFEHGEPAAG